LAVCMLSMPAFAASGMAITLAATTLRRSTLGSKGRCGAGYAENYKRAHGKEVRSMLVRTIVFIWPPGWISHPRKKTS